MVIVCGRTEMWIPPDNPQAAPISWLMLNGAIIDHKTRRKITATDHYSSPTPSIAIFHIE
jgi:hypothetical protein